MDAVNPADLGFFSTLVQCGSLTAAARELGLSTPAVSRRLAQMEQRLGVSLVTRSTRRMGLTPEGELYVEHARRILAELDAMAQRLRGLAQAPAGLLRVNATLGFGRSHIAPLVSQFVRQYPAVDVQLQLSVNPPPLGDDSFDLCFRFGPPPDSRGIARFVAANRRLVVAAPSYLKRHGTPLHPADLARHNCIGIRQGDEAYGQWRFSPARSARRLRPDAPVQTVKVRGNLTTNDGGVAVQWALDGHGVLLRAEWDIQRHLQSGRLIQLLPEHHSPDADIYAFYLQAHRDSPRIKALVDFVAGGLQQGRTAGP